MEMMDDRSTSGTDDLTLPPKPATPDRLRLVAWLAVGLLLVLQYALFRESAQREVVWAYPQCFDQIVFLTRSYEIHEQILENGLVPGLLYGVKTPNANGIMLPVQGGLMHVLLGPSRLSALTLNFVYYALLQCVLFGTVRWYSRRWSVAFVALGLLLAIATPFGLAGGLMDFRTDFIAFCLFGVFVSLVVRSRLFASWRWSLAVGAAGALLVLFRFLSAVYVAGILGVFFLFLCIALSVRRQDAGRRQHLWRQLRGLLSACLVVSVLVLPAVWHNKVHIYIYYVGNHLHNGESEVRNHEFGVYNNLDRLLFYPRSIFCDHAGTKFLLLGGLVLACALATRWFSRTRLVRTDRTRNEPARRVGRPTLPEGVGFTPPASMPASPPTGSAGEPSVTASIAFTASCLVIPMIILALWPSTSPVVGGIVTTGIVWLVVLAALGLSRIHDPRRPGPVPVSWTAAMGALVLLAGFYGYAKRLGRRGWLTRNRPEVEKVLRLYDAIARYSHQHGWRAPRVTVNIISDYLFPLHISLLAYERHRFLLNVQAPMGIALGPVKEADAVAALRQSDFVIFKKSFAAEDITYPYVQSMVKLRPKLLALCAKEFVPLRRFHLFGHDVILYRRPLDHRSNAVQTKERISHAQDLRHGRSRLYR
jgi:hypothetical protein